MIIPNMRKSKKCSKPATSPLLCFKHLKNTIPQKPCHVQFLWRWIRQDLSIYLWNIFGTYVSMTFHGAMITNWVNSYNSLTRIKATKGCNHFPIKNNDSQGWGEQWGRYNPYLSSMMCCAFQHLPRRRCRPKHRSRDCGHCAAWHAAARPHSPSAGADNCRPSARWRPGENRWCGGKWKDFSGEMMGKW